MLVGRGYGGSYGKALADCQYAGFNKATIAAAANADGADLSFPFPIPQGIGVDPDQIGSFADGKQLLVWERVLHILFSN
jgi:hypothetical protein